MATSPYGLRTSTVYKSAADQRDVNSVGWHSTGHTCSRNLGEYIRVLFKKSHPMTIISTKKVYMVRDFLEMYVFFFSKRT